MKNIEEILELLGSKRTFLTKEHFTKDGESRILSKDGVKAYNKLMYLLYGLENVGALENANAIIDKLDKIIANEAQKSRQGAKNS